MTERIDLDDVDVEPDDEQGGERDGDWLWRDDDSADIDGDPRASNGVSTGKPGSAESGAAGEDGDGSGGDEPVRDSQGTRVPHVPAESSGSPAGIPKERGGSGGGAGRSDDESRAAADAEGEGQPASQRGAGGPHGGGVDQMATAYTYDAVQRMDDPRVALAETNEFSDWVGLVGDVPAHAINKFLREHQLDIDFFNGSGDGPAQRLADVDEHSMFYSERMVVVGTESESWIAEEAGWEFVALSDAAAEAGWSLSE